MTTRSLETAELLADQFEHCDTESSQRTPRPFRRDPQRFLKRRRRVNLGANGRNRSRSVNGMMR